MGDIILNPGIIPFNFKTEDGEVWASFSINPMDIKLAARAIEVSDWFDEWYKKYTNAESEKKNLSTDEARQKEATEEVVRLNDELEEKIAYVIGCEKDAIFKVISATTVPPGCGDLWAGIILNKVFTVIQPEVQKRTKAMEKAQQKYLKKYEPK